MRRKRRFAFRAGRPAAALALTFALAASACSRAESASSVILISIDGLRADHLAAYGYSERTAPVFSFIAGKAARFANAYTTAPWTLPAYVSMLSGLYPADHGAVRDDTFPKMGVTLIAERLREAGFKTAAFVTNPYLTKQRGFGQGFDSFVVVPGGDSSAAAEKAAAWLENNATSRVFLFVQFSDPLPPFAPAPERVAKFYPPNLPPYRGGPMDLLDIVDDWPKEEAKRHRRGVIALYDAEINAADAALGALYQTIQERRLDRTATTIVTSPHGMAFMEHGLIGYGTDLHDEQVRVPLAVMTPGHEDAHARIVERVSIVDIAPTLFDAAGFEIPEGLPGASILPLIRRGKDDAGAIAAFRGRPIFMETTVRGPDRIAVVRGDEKYIASPEFAIGGANFGDRLYDLLSDPAEGTNRLDADPGASQSFERELEISGRYRKRRVWSVRFGGNDGGLFTGVVKSAGRFIEVYKDKTIVRRGRGSVPVSDDFVMFREPGAVRFAAAPDKGVNGVHIVVEPPSAMLQFSLISDGKADAGRVRLGEMGAPPAEMPFMIAEGYDGAVPDPRGGYAIASRLVWASRASDDIDGIVDPLRPSANVARRIRARVTTGDESTSELVHRYLQGAGN